VVGEKSAFFGAICTKKATKATFANGALFYFKTIALSISQLALTSHHSFRFVVNKQKASKFADSHDSARN